MHYYRSVWFVLPVIAALVGCSGTVGRPKSRLGAGNGGTSNGEADGGEGLSGDNAGGADGGTGTNAGSTDGTPPAPVGEVNYPCPEAEPKGVVHYVCDCGAGAAADCVAGNDMNNGASASTPWRTFEKARNGFNAMAAGETVAFCRGGSFTTGAGDRWSNASCRANNRCIVRDYKPTWSSASLGAPIINTASTGARGVFSLDNSDKPLHEEGYVFANLSIRGAGEGSGIFFYNDIDDVLVCSSSFDRLGSGIQTGGSNPGTGDRRQARIVVIGNRFTNNSGFGFLGGCDDCVVQDNYFEGNGSRQTFDHNLYLHNDGNLGTPFKNMRVIGNELYRSTIVDGTCQGVSLVVHGMYDNLVIEDNYIHEDLGKVSGECWGISVDAAESEAEGFRNVTIRGNRIENVGGLFIGLHACENCTVEDNIIINMQPGSDAFGIIAPSRSLSAQDLAMSAITVRNNSIYFGAGIGKGIVVGGEGTKHVIASNAIHYAGKGEFACFGFDLPKDSYMAIDNNLCFSPNTTARWEDKAGSLATWKAASGRDQRSAARDPGFASLVAPFDLAAASVTAAMVDQGHATQSSPISIDGKERTAPPDIGAYEH